MNNLFTACRQLVTAEAAAHHFGLQFDRTKKALCPFHDDRHPSLSFKNGRFRCWACGAAGDSIDLTAHLFNLSPLAAVKLLNDKFNLGLPLDRPLTGRELKQQREQAKQRRQERETLAAFERWRYGLLDDLTTIIRSAGQIQAADLDGLSDRQVKLLHQLAAIEHLADILQFGAADEIMDVFRERRSIEWQTAAILNLSQLKSAAA